MFKLNLSLMIVSNLFIWFQTFILEVQTSTHKELMEKQPAALQTVSKENNLCFTKPLYDRKRIRCFRWVLRAF